MHGKGDRRRTVGIDLSAGRIVEAWIEYRQRLELPGGAALFCTLRGSPIPASQIRTLLPRLAREVGIDKRVHPYGLRHTHAVASVQHDWSKPLAHKGFWRTRCVGSRWCGFEIALTGDNVARTRASLCEGSVGFSNWSVSLRRFVREASGTTCRLLALQRFSTGADLCASSVNPACGSAARFINERYRAPDGIQNCIQYYNLTIISLSRYGTACQYLFYQENLDTQIGRM